MRWSSRSPCPSYRTPRPCHLPTRWPLVTGTSARSQSALRMHRREAGVDFRARSLQTRSSAPPLRIRRSCSSGAHFRPNTASLDHVLVFFPRRRHAPLGEPRQIAVLLWIESRIRAFLVLQVRYDYAPRRRGAQWACALCVCAF